VSHSTSVFVNVSYLEIYNEIVNDLLDSTKRNLEVRESKFGGVFVENLTEKHVNSVCDVMKLIN
jgi:hypothetical protein